ncbi:MAG TPA: histidine kinase [Chitinophagaceae bacterium]|nr:histidine kinase [Chitinophagaceae bacterium]
MIRDTYLRAFFIPALGMLIPVISGLVSYSRFSFQVILGANLYFIATSLIIWSGCNWIHGTLRRQYRAGANPFAKILSLCMVSALYGASVGVLAALGWVKLSNTPFSWQLITRFAVVCVFAVILFTLIYEILYLSKERELDTKIVHQLDRERSQAELTALSNELDPHFVFNALNTLSHLILNDPPTAHTFNSRLAKVYRYFLLNRDRELISLHDELEFIEHYFYLLRIRHDNKLRLENHIESGRAGKIMVLPCAIQILVENAIKHNEFSDTSPLHIRISLNDQAIRVANSIRPKPFLVESTKIGLRNLSSRYKLVCSRDIGIEAAGGEFVVKLPLIQ